MTEFYTFRHNSFHTRGFAWAESIRPRSALTSSTCPQCGSVQYSLEGAFDIVIDEGSKYPDVLGCAEYPFLIVSEAVVSDWQKAGISSFHTYPVGIADVQARKLRGVAPPHYLRVEIDGRCQIDLEASGAHVTERCSVCGHVTIEPPMFPGFHMAADSWDGAPLFRDPELFPRVNFCTRKVVELARSRQWTNIRFELIEEALL